MQQLVLLLLVAPTTGLAPAAVDALLSIGDGERLTYLDFREALHNEWSGNVSGPAVAAVLTACGGSYCRPDPPVGRWDLAGSNRPIGRRPTDRLVADAKARAAVERFWRPRTETRPLSHAFVLAHHQSRPHLAREAVLSRYRFYGDAWVCVLDQGAAARPDDSSARDLVRTLRAAIDRPDRLLLANGTKLHELSAYANGVRAIVAAAGSFPDLWLFSHATTVLVRPFPHGHVPPCGVARLGPSPGSFQARCSDGPAPEVTRDDALRNANVAVGTMMAARLGLDVCPGGRPLPRVRGVADSTILATGEAVENSLLAGFDAYASAVAATRKTLDAKMEGWRVEDWLHALSDHVSGVLVAADGCAAAAPLSDRAHGFAGLFVAKLNGIPCNWGQCAVGSALRLIAEGDTDSNGVLTRAELARLEAPASSCDANPHTLRTRGKWTGLERVCHAVLCDHGRSRELKRANRTQWRALVEGHPACLSRGSAPNSPRGFDVRPSTSSLSPRRRIALCISGELRTFAFTVDQNLVFIRGLEAAGIAVDVFVAVHAPTPDPARARVVRGAAAALGARAVQIASAYGPDVDARMVERKCRNQVVEQMWGFVKLSYALATAYEKTTGVRYDHVIRHRTDTVCRNASRLLADAGAALGLVGSTVDPRRDPVFLGNTQQGRQGRAQQDFFWIATRPVADVAMRAVDYALNDNGTCGLRDATFFFEDNHERIIRARVPDVRVLLPPKQSFCCDKVGHQNNRKARPSSHYLVPSGFCPGGPHPSSHAMAHYSNASARKCALAFVGCPHVDYN